VVFRRNLSFLSVVPIYSSRKCGLVGPEVGGKINIRYLGNYLAYLPQDINI